eukprot:Gb_11466 [translate_table: standard]
MENSAASSNSVHSNDSENAFEGIAQALLLPTQTLSNGPYDVFINHRGKDVKKSLASSIYHTLELCGVRAFLDSEELQHGDFIPANVQEAVRSASLHIAIFSENYAESPWCLEELSLMLKTGGKIIPVFYHLKPCALRYNEKGVYAHAFAQHEEKRRYHSKKLSEWKEALNNGRLLKGIISNVLKEVKRVPLEVAKHPVGLDEIVQDFENEIADYSVMESGNVKIVGIVGMGGSGKTTLAKELFNRKRSAYDRSSFLSDVRDASAKNELQRLQSQLLKDLANIDCKINSTSEGKGILRDRLPLNYNIRSLLVLDDIDHEDQLDAFIARDMLIRSDSSLIIVTTRDEGVLRRSGITIVYKVKGLDAKHARELFCWHAFLESLPLIGFEGLVEEFLSVADGLPLSVKVFGGHLYGNHDRDYWEAELEKISRILPNDIISILKISYDALDEEEKQMFLDIACFLIGHDKNKGIRIWNGSGWSGSHSLQTLEYKCLVEIGDENCLKMHDHLRDLGRNIADQACVTHSNLDPCRLWRSEQGTKFLKGQMEIKHVRGVVARGHQGEPSKWYGRIPLLGSRLINPIDSGVELKLLDVNSDHHVKSKLSQDLLWLRCSDCSHRSLRWLSLKNLRVLELDEVNTQKLWHDAQAPLQLRELKIFMKYKCKPANFPRSIQFLKHLEKIVLKHWRGNSLPEEFCGLQSLRHLTLDRCSKLRSLPKRFGDLTNLQHLGIRHCEALVISQSFNQLTQLQYLDLSYSRKIQFQPDILGIKVTTLEELSVRQCSTFPQESLMQITRQASLRKLDLLGDFYFKQMPDEFWSLTNLQVLKMSRHSLVSLPPSLGNLIRLTHLELKSCKDFKCLPGSLGQLKQLTHLIISGSGIEYLPTMSHLQHITLSQSKLQILSISGDDCPNLETLILSDNECLEEVETLPASLVKLNLEGCIILKRIPASFSLPKLQSLIISGCRELKELPSVVHLISLGTLEAMDCWKLQRIEGLEHLQRLQFLFISADNAVIWNWMRTQRLPFISTIIFRGRSVRGNGVRVVESILNSFSFDYKPVWSAVIVCSAIDIIATRDWKYRPDLLCYLPRPFDETTEHGEWIQISIIRPNSMFRSRFRVKDQIDRMRRAPKKYGIKRAWVVMLSNGEERQIEEVLPKLFNTMLP